MSARQPEFQGQLLVWSIRHTTDLRLKEMQPTFILACCPAPLLVPLSPLEIFGWLLERQLSERLGLGRETIPPAEPGLIIMSSDRGKLVMAPSRLTCRSACLHRAPHAVVFGRLMLANSYSVIILALPMSFLLLLCSSACVGWPWKDQGAINLGSVQVSNET